MCLFTLPIGITSRSSPPFWFVYALFLTFTRPAWSPFSSMADIHTRQYLRSVDLAGIEYDRRITTVRTVLPLDFPNLCLCYFTPFRLPTISNHSCPPRNVCSILSFHSGRWVVCSGRYGSGSGIHAITPDIDPLPCQKPSPYHALFTDLLPDFVWHVTITISSSSGSRSSTGI